MAKSEIISLSCPQLQNSHLLQSSPSKDTSYGKIEGQTFLYIIRKNILTVGKNSKQQDVDINLGYNKYISKVHLIIELIDSEFFVTCPSRNGIFINGRLDVSKERKEIPGICEFRFPSTDVRILLTSFIQIKRSKPLSCSHMPVSKSISLGRNAAESKINEIAAKYHNEDKTKDIQKNIGYAGDITTGLRIGELSRNWEQLPSFSSSEDNDGEEERQPRCSGPRNRPSYRPRMDRTLYGRRPCRGRPSRQRAECGMSRGSKRDDAGRGPAEDCEPGNLDSLNVYPSLSQLSSASGKSSYLPQTNEGYSNEKQSLDQNGQDERKNEERIPRGGGGSRRAPRRIYHRVFRPIPRRSSCDAEGIQSGVRDNPKDNESEEERQHRCSGPRNRPSYRPRMDRALYGRRPCRGRPSRQRAECGMARGSKRDDVSHAGRGPAEDCELDNLDSLNVYPSLSQLSSASGKPSYLPQTNEGYSNKKQSTDQKTKICVGHLPDGCTDDDLHNLFAKYGEVTECDVINKYGFVHMAIADQADEAMKNLNNYNLMGSSISVELQAGKSHQHIKNKVKKKRAVEATVRLPADTENSELGKLAENYRIQESEEKSIVLSTTVHESERYQEQEKTSADSKFLDAKNELIKTNYLMDETYTSMKK